jgi:hypothetical protein
MKAIIKNIKYRQKKQKKKKTYYHYLIKAPCCFPATETTVIITTNNKTLNRTIITPHSPEKKKISTPLKNTHL